ncbi:hypothetical protein N5K35_11395 [Pseudomonas sp. GD03651]|uniref:hypothetical protein n=1 Tax=Pseudomonas TaxID=286 RepID=UPI0012FE2F60|nr:MULTISPECIES: hypothetical protein [Pseudomonas]MBP2082801.1 hypothetical protein [Pseudomonas sp. PvP089]MDH2184315.1 hypothetical protein [Pseudomonas sp. GD03651]
MDVLMGLVAALCWKVTVAITSRSIGTQHVGDREKQAVATCLTRGRTLLKVITLQGVQQLKQLEIVVRLGARQNNDDSFCSRPLI